MNPLLEKHTARNPDLLLDISNQRLLELVPLVNGEFVRLVVAAARKPVVKAFRSNDLNLFRLQQRFHGYCYLEGSRKLSPVVAVVLTREQLESFNAEPESGVGVFPPINIAPALDSAPRLGGLGGHPAIVSRGDGSPTLAEDPYDFDLKEIMNRNRSVLDHDNGFFKIQLSNHPESMQKELYMHRIDDIPEALSILIARLKVLEQVEH